MKQKIDICEERPTDLNFYLLHVGYKPDVTGALNNLRSFNPYSTNRYVLKMSAYYVCCKFLVLHLLTNPISGKCIMFIPPVRSI